MFYGFGGLGIVWALLWAVLGKDYTPPSTQDSTENSAKSKDDEVPIPWQQILTCPPLWGIVAAHFCHDWGMYALLTWMPTYLNKALGFDLTGSSELTVVPSIAAIAVAALAGSQADRLLRDGWELTAVRKTFQSLGFLVPGISLGLLGFLGASDIQLPQLVYIILLILGVAGGSFSLAGVYSSHADLNTKYSGLVNGISTTFGALAGVFANAYAGQTLSATGGSWSQAIFIPSVACYVVGLAAYVALYDATPRDWDAEAAKQNA
eukprot:TRINITY_DN57873_c0_g1_i1.p1 TRINITY_DN57873_c0_g1~~TRINITY_DN57873_c0_g1_i1.p1  ORF type:complete len:291 (+),score=43.39 TRINITY_DN57873_c0_g1_i1:84-875(+)